MINMSFWDIKDQDKRDKIVHDYLAVKKRIKKRNENERSIGLLRRRDLEEQFEPIVKSQRQMTKNK